MAATSTRSSGFQVRVTSRSLVKAGRPPLDFPAVIPASNLDLILGSFHVSLTAIYPAPSDVGGFDAAVAAIRSTLPAFLDRLFPLAGRIVVSADTGLREIRCENSGAELVVAEAGVALADVDFADVDRSLELVQVPFADSLALSLQVVRFACGGFSLAWGTNHLLVDGNGLAALPTALSELLLNGELSRSLHFDRSFLRPRSPPLHSPELDREFVRFVPETLINPMLAATLVRRNYRIDAAAVERLRAAASHGGAVRRATRLEAFSAHLWKLLAAAVGDSDASCRMAWIVDGRKALAAKLGDASVESYMGNVITYVVREIAVAAAARSPLADLAAAAHDAVAEAQSEERFQNLVDWMEAKKLSGAAAGKWTESVVVGTGSPAVIVSSFLPFRVNGDFGFGKPRFLLPWVRRSRLGSATVTVARSPKGDGSWLASTRLWPALVAAIEEDPAAVMVPLTAERLGFVGATDQATQWKTSTSRL